MKMLLLLIGVAPFAIAAPAIAQSMDHSMPGMNMPGMQMPAKKKPTAKSNAKPAAKPKPKPSVRPATKAQPRKLAPAKAPKVHVNGNHDMSGMENMQGMDMSGGGSGQAEAPGGGAADPHAGHDMSSMPGSPTPAEGAAQPMEHDMPAMPGMNMGNAMPGHGKSGTALPAGNAPAPAAPADHYADRVYSPSPMAEARTRLRREHGGGAFHQVMFNLAEYQARDGRDGYRWDGEAWLGGDLNRLTLKTEGEGSFGRSVESAEIQALYSRALDPYWNLQAGVRHDFKPNPSRTYATIGIEGLAPYWFEVEGALFLSDKGDVLGRIEGYYDQRITQRLILQPRVELNFAAQDVPENRIGSGLSNAELGLRLRYETTREFAPYIGVSYDRKVGDTARFARADGEDVKLTSFVVGVRTWF